MKWRIVHRAPRPEAEDLATIVERGTDSPLVWEGRVLARRPDHIDVERGSDFPFGGESQLLIAAGPLGNREAAFARLKGLHGNVASLSTLTPWLPVNRRQQERFPATLPATVVGRLGEHAGQVVDVSLGGLALAVPKGAALGIRAVRMDSERDAPSLPLRVVATEDRGDSFVLHAQFGTLSVQAHEYIARLVGELSASFERGLLRAAG